MWSWLPPTTISCPNRQLRRSNVRLATRVPNQNDSGETISTPTASKPASELEASNDNSPAEPLPPPARTTDVTRTAQPCAHILADLPVFVTAPHPIRVLSSSKSVTFRFRKTKRPPQARGPSLLLRHVVSVCCRTAAAASRTC